MQYEPIKRSVGRFFTGPAVMRKILYMLLDLLLLRAWHIKKALKKISRTLPSDSSVLDAGAGFGQYTWRMSRINPRWNIKAVDINSEHVDDCNKFFSKAGLSGRVPFEICDLTTLNEADRYNLILCVDVMEHIEEDLTVFRNFHSALKKDGCLLISTPSDQGGSDVHGEDEESFIDEHVRDGYGMGEIRDKLRQAGFRNIEISYTYGKPGNISWRLSMKYPVKMLNRSYAFFILLPFYYLIFFPVCLVLNILDLYTVHKTGTGLIVTARK